MGSPGAEPRSTSTSLERATLWEPQSLEVPQQRRVHMGEAGSLPMAVAQQALQAECDHGWNTRAAGPALMGEWWALPTLSAHRQMRMRLTCDPSTVGHDRRSQELRITVLYVGPDRQIDRILREDR